MATKVSRADVTAEYRTDFILHLQERLQVSSEQARSLLASWMQDFAPRGHRSDADSKASGGEYAARL